MRALTALAAFALAAVGCGPELPRRVGLAGQSATLQSGTQVNFQDAWVTRDEVQVKVWVANMSDTMMFVDRDGWALRLSDGGVAPREGVVHHVYTIAPGTGHEVFVKFRERGADMRTYSGMSLIVGGISYATDPRPRVVGEIPLVQSGAR
jgi:hypothetical protein